MRNKLNFDFDFLKTQNDSDISNTITSEEKIALDNTKVNEVKEIISSIFRKLDIYENDIEKITSCKTDMLIGNLKHYCEIIDSNVLNTPIALELQQLAKQIIDKNKNIEALKLLNYAYSITDSETLKERLKDQINSIKKQDNHSNDSTETSFTKIKYNDGSNIKIKPIIIISIILFIGIFFIIGTCLDNKRNREISQIKNNAYSYLTTNDRQSFEREIAKLSQYGIDEVTVINDLEQQYENEKQRIIADIAYSYENNKAQFNSLKLEYLPKYFNNNEKEFNETIEKKLGYKELSLKPVSMPKSGIIHNYTGKEAIAPFEIKTQANDNNDPLGLYNDNYYIKLVDPNTNKTKLVIFMRGGETKKMDIPLGTYKIKKATGNTWYGEKYLFGHSTQYSTSDELLDFRINGSFVEGHILTLYKVANGNFSTKDISAEDF